jgi:hypothetical protein
MQTFPYDVNTTDGRARVRELVTQGRLPRWPLSTEVVAAQLDVSHDDLLYRRFTDADWTAILRRFGIDEADERRASWGYLFVEKGILTPLEGIWLDGDDEETFFAGVLAEFTDAELAEELRCDPRVIWRLQLWPRYHDGAVNTAHIAESLGCDYSRLVELVRAMPTPDELYEGARLPTYRHLLHRYRQLQPRDSPPALQTP